INPVKDLRVKLYWCDSSFHLDPLKEMFAPQEVYALVVMDKKEATIGIIIGKRYEILGTFGSMVFGKFRAGGQSAHRFEHLREEAEHDFYRKVSERMNQIFTPYDDKLKGVIVGGPGATKNYFIDTGLLDHRLKAKILGTLDTGYTDDAGIRELVQKSEELLKNTDLMAEKTLINKFFETIAKDGLAVYGQKETEDALNLGKISQLVLSESIPWIVLKVHCESCNNDEEIIFKTEEEKDNYTAKCGKCRSSSAEIMEEIDYLDYMMEKAHTVGAETIILSTDSPEGEQFYKGFGGIGAFTRYK
ncbi:MAG: peptide chain release factor aRF-1, partial [Candidatus Diapherotrites archaeon]|nr:peptide chain release factor aRF-1 [Candidatus Diapherotrites archaeon]